MLSSLKPKNGNTILPNWLNFDGVKYPNAPKIICCSVNIWSETNAFSCRALIGQMFTAKLILWPKMGVTYTISMVYWILVIFYYKIFVAFLRWYKFIDVP